MLPLPSGACCQPPGPGAGAVWPLLQTLCPFCTLPWKESRPPARVFSGVPSPRSTIPGVSLEDVTLGAMSPRYSGFSQDTSRVGSVHPILLPIACALCPLGDAFSPALPPALPSCTCSGHTGRPARAHSGFLGAEGRWGEETPAEGKEGHAHRPAGPSPGSQAERGPVPPFDAPSPA